MRKHIYSLLSLFFVFGTLLFTGCGQEKDFTVTGVVSGADGQMLFLENVTLNAVATLDSAKLNAAGKFKFNQPRPASPEFYRLRLNNQLINFAVDSTETISFIADAGTFATSYSVEGGENNIAIKNITLAQLDANQAYNRLRREQEGGQLSDTTYIRLVGDIAGEYKKLALDYIYKAPMSSAAYFALFQQIDGMLFFNPYDNEDLKAFAAVATSLDFNYPNSQRNLHLKNLTLQAMQVRRQQRDINLDDVNVNEVSYLDIDLPNEYDQAIKLSEKAKGKVVLLSFTAFVSEWSPEFNMDLGDLYEKYASRGLEIYQVSVDTDDHLWRNIAVNLPWTTVRDPQSIYSQIAALYNVRQLPSLFLIDKKGEIVKKVESLNTLDADIRKLL